MAKSSLIFSFYNDYNKINWLTYVPPDVELIAYKKNDYLKKNQIFTENGGYPVHNIPNYGRCDYAFLLHIVNNYDNLSDYNIFTKINWQETGVDLTKLFFKYKNYDYCDVGAWPELHIWSNEEDLIKLEKIKINNAYLNQNSEYKSISVNSTKQLKRGSFSMESYIDWYVQFFNNTKLPDPIKIWGHGPCFSVSKNLIQRHPKQVYEILLNKFYKESNSWNFEESFKFFKNKTNSNVQDNEIEIFVNEEIGKAYHDQFQRFWKLLFTHNTKSDKFKIES